MEKGKTIRNVFRQGLERDESKAVIIILRCPNNFNISPRYWDLSKDFE